MTRTHTLEDNSPLRRSLDLLRGIERGMLSVFKTPDGNVTLTGPALKFYLEVLEELATIQDDLNEAAGAVRYYERLLQYDSCFLSRRTNATLEYEYCSGRLFSRCIILYRALGRVDLSQSAFTRATARTFLG